MQLLRDNRYQSSHRQSLFSEVLPGSILSGICCRSTQFLHALLLHHPKFLKSLLHAPSHPK